MSLDDIWDVPVSPSTPVKRPRQRLFFSDSDSDNERPPKRATPAPVPAPDPELDALFADIEEDGTERNDKDDAEDLRYKPLAPALDLAKLAREAEERHARERRTKMPALTPHQVMSSSPPPPDDPSGAGRNAKGNEKGKSSEEGKKVRRKPAILDEERLVGPSGFPQLIKEVKGFKLKGKGHEHPDLNRLLQVYQFWTHRMFPKTPFKDTVDRVEKLCHSKRMQVRLSVWRDEAKGLVNGNKPEDEEPDVIDLTGPGTTTSGKEAPSLPATSFEPDDNDFDIDAVIKAEEERLAALQNGTSISSPESPVSKPSSSRYRERNDADKMDVDEEALWNQLDVPQVLPEHPKAAPQTSAREDDDVWNIVDELEQGEQNPKPKALTSNEVPMSAVVFTSSGSGENGSRATNDEGWDEMYV
ncbi:replication fork protection component Swi3-domain-containing protein [Scleroderma yunnanense]